MKIRKHIGINQKTGRLKKGYRYSGRRLKNGSAEIVRVLVGGGKASTKKKGKRVYGAQREKKMSAVKRKIGDTRAHGIGKDELKIGREKLKKICPECPVVKRKIGDTRAHGIGKYELKIGREKLKKISVNRCPGCGYDMGADWPSQYCSRSCMMDDMV